MGKRFFRAGAVAIIFFNCLPIENSWSVDFLPNGTVSQCSASGCPDGVDDLSAGILFPSGTVSQCSASGCPDGVDDLSAGILFPSGTVSQCSARGCPDESQFAAADKAAAEADAALAAAEKAAAEADAALAAAEKADAARAKAQEVADKAAAAKAAAAKAAASKKSTITCIKGKLTKKVTAVNPKCPSGYKVKK